MEANLNDLPVEECPIASKFGFETKLIPVYRGEEQIAWRAVSKDSPGSAILYPAPTKIIEPTQDDYIALLKRHDWEYEYSADGRVYRNGKAERLAIEALQPKFDPDFMLWNQFCHHLHRRVPAKAAA